MSEKLSELIRLLDIEKVEENLFIANHPEGEQVDFMADRSWRRP